MRFRHVFLGLLAATMAAEGSLGQYDDRVRFRAGGNAAVVTPSGTFVAPGVFDRPAAFNDNLARLSMRRFIPGVAGAIPRFAPGTLRGGGFNQFNQGQLVTLNGTLADAGSFFAPDTSVRPLFQAPIIGEAVSPQQDLNAFALSANNTAGVLGGFQPGVFTGANQMRLVQPGDITIPGTGLAVVQPFGTTGFAGPNVPITAQGAAVPGGSFNPAAGVNPTPNAQVDVRAGNPNAQGVNPNVRNPRVGAAQLAQSPTGSALNQNTGVQFTPGSLPQAQAFAGNQALVGAGGVPLATPGGVFVMQTPQGPVLVTPQPGVTDALLQAGGGQVQLRGQLFERGGLRFLVPSAVVNRARFQGGVNFGQSGTTAIGQPRGTNFGQSGTTAIGQPPGTNFGQSGTTAIGQPPGTNFGQSGTTAIGQPVGTNFGQSGTTAIGQPAGTNFGRSGTGGRAGAVGGGRAGGSGASGGTGGASGR